MSKEEVQRKLEEIRRLYGGQGGPIVDVTPKQIEEEPVEDESVEDDVVVDAPDAPAPENEDEEENDGTETGIDLLQEAERKRPRLPFHPD
jgi:hypothetical protein